MPSLQDARRIAQQTGRPVAIDGAQGLYALPSGGVGTPGGGFGEGPPQWSTPGGPPMTLNANPMQGPSLGDVGRGLWNWGGALGWPSAHQIANAVAPALPAAASRSPLASGPSQDTGFFGFRTDPGAAGNPVFMGPPGGSGAYAPGALGQANVYIPPGGAAPGPQTANVYIPPGGPGGYAAPAYGPPAPRLPVPPIPPHIMMAHVLANPGLTTDQLNAASLAAARAGLNYYPPGVANPTPTSQ